MNLRLLPNFVVVSPEGVVPDQELPEDVRAAMELLTAINRCGGHYMATDGQLHYSGPPRFKQALRVQRDVIISLLGPAPKESCRALQGLEGGQAMTSPWRRRDGSRRGSTRAEKKLRLQVFARDRWICWFCKQLIDPRLPPNHPRAAQVHHLIGVATLDARNLVAAHRECNFRAGSPGKLDPRARVMTNW